MGATGVMLATFVATANVGAAAPGQVAADLGPGVGTAIAQSLKVDPRAGNLSIAVTVGQALSGIQGQVGQAESKALDLGVIGTTLAAEPCDGEGEPTLPSERQPKGLQTDSRNPEGPGGLTEQDSFVPVVTKYVRADGIPSSEAKTTTASFTLPGVITLAGLESSTITRVVDDSYRESIARVEVGSIRLAGAIEIGGLTWEAIYRSGSETTKTGSFTVGSVKIAGIPVPLLDPLSLLATLNAVLNPLGVELQLPTVHEANGILFVDPFGLKVVPNALRDGIFNTILGGIQPIREPLFAMLLEAYCDTATYITVSDIAIGSITGAGSFGLLLGGVQASSGDQPSNGFQLGGTGTRTPGAPTAPTGGTTSGGTTSGGTTALPRTSMTGVPTTIASTPTTVVEETSDTEPVSDVKGKRGGALAGVGLAGLALLGLVAEGDRRKMRQAQRQIPLEA